jgi:polysaccharide biosynthesis transport protein
MTHSLSQSISDLAAYSPRSALSAVTSPARRGGGGFAGLKDNDFPPQTEDAYESSATPAINIADILGTLCRGWRLLAFGSLIGLMLAVAYIAYAPALYRSNARVLIDLSVNRYLQSNKIVDEPTFHQAEIGSQVYILSSESVIVPVVRSMNLVHDTEFVGSPNAADGKIAKFKKFVKQLIGLNAGADTDAGLDPEAALERKAVENFLSRLTVYREDVGNVINVAFASAEPKKAADIANAVADTYIATTFEAKYNSTKTMSQWLQDRLKELKEQAIQADRALQDYKIANNLVNTGKGQLGGDELTRLNLQLTEARIAMAEAKARLERIDEQLNNEGVSTAAETELRMPNSGAKSGALSYALNNSDLVRLRAQYRELDGRANDIRARVGGDHSLVVKLRQKMDELRSSIREEEQRIADSYSNEYQIAKAKENELAASLAKLIEQTEVNSQSQVKMRELESSAETFRTLYNSFLQKFNEINTVQSQTIPVQDARIVTRAAPPLQKSYKKEAAVLAGGLIFGLLLGAGAAMGREWVADVFRTPKAVEQVTNRTCVILPMVEPKPKSGAKFWHATRLQPIEEFILDAPYSRFTESLRNIKALIDTGPRVEGAKVIGVVSSLAREGKTTIAANLAALMIASSGARTLIIDADLHRRLLTAALAPEATRGLIEALDDPSQLPSLVCKRERSGLDILPCALSTRVPNAAELLGSAKMEELLAVARRAYDYIIVEVAPIMSVVDIKMIERFIDSFIFVVEWGHTKRSLVLEALAEAPNMHERVSGIVLNKVDPTALRSIEAYKGDRFRNYYEE